MTDLLHRCGLRTAIVAVLTAFFISLLAGVGGMATTTAGDEEIALSLATLLRSARAVISNKQTHINDPEIGDKGLSPDVVVGIAKENYRKATGTDIDSIDPNSKHGRLIAAELQAITNVMADAQATINEKGVGLKGFLPAVFARLVTQEFAAVAGDQALLKLTAPKSYVRNRVNRPDKWEHDVIESMFKSPDYERGRHYFETTTIDERSAFRLILPEYYKESCLACHGEPAGETDITGGRKEGGRLGELGGAISVIIFD